MFSPPVNRAMQTLDRSFFNKQVSLSAARILANKSIQKHRLTLLRSGELLNVDRVPNIRPDPDPILASQGLPDSWSQALNELQKGEHLTLVPYQLHLMYDHWSYLEILQSVLPEDLEEIPTGFSVVGHVAHLNLREQHLPFKRLIAEVLMDKNPTIQTVINKVDNVGDASVFRTFQYEVLAGRDYLNVEVHDEGCIFNFDYSKVYWNSRLNTEHRRLVDRFKTGEAVCDVMAGVGPFALPAGKRGVHVWANDLNPHCFQSLTNGIKRNKVIPFVRPFNLDGRVFISEAVRELNDLHERGAAAVEIVERPRGQPAVVKKLPLPKTFSHFIMNLPASAITFLDAFIGLYRGHEQDYAPHTNTKLPFIHVYCFSALSETIEEEEKIVCSEISTIIGFELTPDTPEVHIWDVRNVAPKKRMFCVSFRLPPEVAFRQIGA